jgi:deazaflavin-dependent oxidoreductase (nitroreductase family)
MTSQEEVFDSPKGWVSKHIDEYVETDGQKGYEWRNGAPTLLLTTRGRKTGKLRRTALIFGADGDRYLLVASVGGAAKHPAWYLNLVANPEVELQVKAERFKGRARTATAQEKPRLWRLMASIWPDYDNYQTKTEREIPVVIVDRV